MEPSDSPTRKPRSTRFRPEMTCLPQLTPGRLRFRRFIQSLCRLLVTLLTRVEVSGLENVPKQGPALLASNHLGDADFFVGLAYAPRLPEVVAKSELYDLPLLGKFLDLYGVIWVHRGQPDRRALRAVQEGFEQGRLAAIAPEGRESLTGALEEGTEGAAYLALRGNVPVIPVTLTGTTNNDVFRNLRRLRRTRITLTVGKPFRLESLEDRQAALQQGTHTIMLALARQLPPTYRGVYAGELEDEHGSQ